MFLVFFFFFLKCNLSIEIRIEIWMTLQGSFELVRLASALISRWIHLSHRSLMENQNAVLGQATAQVFAKDTLPLEFSCSRWFSMEWPLLLKHVQHVDDGCREWTKSVWIVTKYIKSTCLCSLAKQQNCNVECEPSPVVEPPKKGRWTRECESNMKMNEECCLFALRQS